MTATEAKDRLRKMQKQIIHGSNVFGEIADCIEALEEESKSLQGNTGALCPRCGNWRAGHATGAADICVCT